MTTGKQYDDFHPVRYGANNDMISRVSCLATGGSRCVWSLSHGVNRLTQISSQSSASIPAVSFNYSYNSANQRTQDQLADGSHWAYQYDSLGQVTNGNKYFYDNTIVPGQQFNYAFDTTRPMRYGKVLLRLRSAQPDRWQPLRWSHAGFAQPLQPASGGRGAVDENASTI
jgi:YD repeat-containing protein